MPDVLLTNLMFVGVLPESDLVWVTLHEPVDPAVEPTAALVAATRSSATIATAAASGTRAVRADSRANAREALGEGSPAGRWLMRSLRDGSRSRLRAPRHDERMRAHRAEIGPVDVKRSPDRHSVDIQQHFGDARDPRAVRGDPALSTSGSDRAHIRQAGVPPGSLWRQRAISG